MNLEEKQDLTDECKFNNLVNNFLPLYIINDGLKNIIHSNNAHFLLHSID